jgi:ER degradation enhancer, mannosidase alpha-like 1
VGGLLSAHQLANKLLTDLEVTSSSGNNSTSAFAGESQPSVSSTSFYDGHFLLDLAADLGRRLLPAFYTLSGVPVHRVNLRYGFREGENAHTCTAAGTSFLLEMGLLSRLTGDPNFEYYARRALKAVWSRRSPLNLVGSMIDVNTGEWTPHGQHTGTGAGVDSFYETMLKSAILLGDDEINSWFEEAYEAIEEHSQQRVS